MAIRTPHESVADTQQSRLLVPGITTWRQSRATLERLSQAHKEELPGKMRSTGISYIAVSTGWFAFLGISSVMLGVTGVGIFGVSRFLFLGHEIPAFLLTSAFIIGAVAVAFYRRARWFPDLIEAAQGRVSVWMVALFSFGVAVLGTRYVYLEFALSMDEWMPRLQATIFRDWQLTAIVDPEWRPWGHMMYHSFASFDKESGALASGYRPGFAAIIALFDLAGLGPYTSTLLHGGAVALIAAVTRQVAPGHRGAPLISALLLATSLQAIGAAMTTYAMSAHLFLNLLWLHLFVRQRLVWHFCAAIVGVATASLHQVHMHLFFAAPFFLLLLRPLQFRVLALYAVIYLVGHLLVIEWDRVLIDQTSGDLVQGPTKTLDTVLRIFHMPSIGALAAVWTNLGRLVFWQNLAFLPLLLVWFLGTARQTRIEWLLFASVALSLLPYLFLMPDQGHGWGYRYLHGLLGNLFILCAIGYCSLSSEERHSRFVTFAATLLVISPLVMIPLRAAQISQIVRPYRDASEWLHSRTAEVVLVDNYSAAIGQDLPRNAAIAPQLPIVMYLSRAVPGDILALCTRKDTLVVTGDDLTDLGIIRVQPKDTTGAEDYFYLWETINTAGCRRLPDVKDVGQ